jgi:hypothetical protein
MAPRPGVRVFVSGVASVSHLAHVGAYVRALVEDGEAPVTVVLFDFVAFLGSVRVTEADARALLPQAPGLEVVLASGPEAWHGQPGERLVYVAVGAPGIKPWARLRLRNRRPLHVVVVDEGLGSYGDWRSRWYALRHERSDQRSRPAQGLRRAFAVTLAQRALMDERRPLYRRSADGWVIDAAAAAEMRRAGGEPVRDPGTALLLSQPWVELGHISADRYLEVLGELQHACAAAGLTLRVRPHPVEDRSRYAHLPLDAGYGPAELDPRVGGAGVLLGFNSTALINCATLHRTPALRLVLPELAGVEASMTADQKSLLQQFVPLAVPPHSAAAALRSLSAGAGAPPRQQTRPSTLGVPADQ